MSIACAILWSSLAAVSPVVQLRSDDVAEQLAWVVDGREVLVYQYGAKYALPHYWPVRSPSGKLLTIQNPEPYPHHRSLWIADHVQFENAPAVDFYHCWKNYRNPDQSESGFRHVVRHQRFGQLMTDGAIASVQGELQWVIDQTRPVLDERRTLRVIALGDGEYFIDLSWKLTAAHGPVAFVSDRVHYAWPYVRMHPQFSGEQGGAITNDSGLTGEAGTNGKVAKWIDYSNTIEGDAEGLAVFIYPDGDDREWLTREYGVFGPRRPESYNGTKFTLKSGESLSGRVGILVHRGNAASGRVAERYRQYINGNW